MSVSATAGDEPVPVPTRPPAWLIAATGLLASTVLVLAVAETNLWAHYLIDEGEYLSLFGLAFILGAGIVLYRSRRLFVSLPLVFPWLLYPIITQGDQIIDNLSINPMRVIVHLLLAAIFGTPVAVAVLAARYLFAPKHGRAAREPGRWAMMVPGIAPLMRGRLREGTAMLATSLVVAEMWIADRFLGSLMILTLVILALALLVYGSLPEPPREAGQDHRRRSERFALGVLVAGVAVSLGAYVGYKNQPGAYQGSPSFFMDPARKDVVYPLDRVKVPARAASATASGEAVGAALTAYAHTLERLLAGYHVLDRNYTYDFHNALFLRHTPLVPQYRAVGLGLVAEAQQLREDADRKAAAVRSGLAGDDPLRALLDDIGGYVAFTFERAPVLERLSAGFERTQAGLQHAAHLYEGEGKFLGTRLADLVAKHHAAIESPALQPVTATFAAASRSIHDAYAHHVVGF